MPEPGVDAAFHQHVTVVPARLDVVVEVGAGLGHCYRSDDLTEEDEREADGDDDWMVQAGLPVREEEGGDEAFEQRGGVGGVVAASVGAEEEGGDGGVGNVVSGGDVELEEVEEGDRGEEEGGSPVVSVAVLIVKRAV